MSSDISNIEATRSKIIRKNGIDVLRFFGAFFIMILHANYGNLNPELVGDIRLLSRWAVPFYFMASGYFLGTKIERNGILDFGKIQKNIAFLITLFIVSSIVYLPFKIANGSTSFPVSYLLTGTYFHLWFIGSMIVGYLFIWYLYFINRSALLPYVSILIIVAALFSDSYDTLFDYKLAYESCRFLLSIPFIYFGILFSKNKQLHIPTLWVISAIIIGIVLQLFEAQMFNSFFGYSKHQHQFLIGTIIIVVPLFYLGLIGNFNENKLSRWGREHSVFIYLYHPMVYFVLNYLLKKSVSEEIVWPNLLLPIVGFIITLVISVFLKNYFTAFYSLLNGELQVKREIGVNR
jgi:hypothetical protein